MFKAHFLIGICLGVGFFACRLPMIFSQKSDNQIYFNSFESAEDTLGWYGNGFFMLDNRSAPGGGDHSLLVSGGCIIPHARYFLGQMKQDGYLTMQVWGRNLELGGFVSLESQSEPPVENGFSITDTAWTLYNLEKPFHVKRNSDVYINLNSGGIAYSAMLIDLIRVTFTEGE